METSPNRREGIEEILQNFVEHAHERDCVPRLREALNTFHHQELQKARHDWLREEIVKLEALINTNEADGHAHDPAIAYEEGCNDTIQTIIDRHQAELTTLTPKT